MSTPVGSGAGACRVSIICTVRNEARHLPLAIASVLIPGVDEVIVVDDGSTDGTPVRLRELSRADERVAVISAGPIGRAAALRAATERARGSFVVNIDADDTINPGWIDVGVQLLAARPEAAVVAAAPLYIGAGQAVDWPAIDPDVRAADVTRRLALYNPVNHSSAVIRRAALEAVGGYDASRVTHVDYDLWVRLAAAGWRLYSVPDRLVAKRVHAGQKFEVHGRLPYVLASVGVQARAIRALGGGWIAWGVLAGRLAWGVLPHAVRLGARRLLARRRAGSVRPALSVEPAGAGPRPHRRDAGDHGVGER